MRVRSDDLTGASMADQLKRLKVREQFILFQQTAIGS